MLQGRLATTEKLLLRAAEAEAAEEGGGPAELPGPRELLARKKARLEGQLAEAEQLKQFRDRRGRAVAELVSDSRR